MSGQNYNVKGRLNLLPTKVVPRRIGIVLCPKCRNAPDTLFHTLSACTPMSGLMRERHNKIVHRLEGATGRLAGTVLIDQKVPNSSCQLRPDIVCIDHQNNKIALIDVTIPGETNGEAFEKARNEKERKYGDLLQWCKDKYSEASYDSFVVGALGAYDTNNETALDRLHVAKKYRNLFRRLCVLDAIQGSHEIWKARCATSNTTDFALRTVCQY